jgi:hypothetical protein
MTFANYGKIPTIYIYTNLFPYLSTTVLYSDFNPYPK